MTVTCNDPQHEFARWRDRTFAGVPEHADPSGLRFADMAAQGWMLPDGSATVVEAWADYVHGTPCIICGAPVIDGYGHDEGCMGLDS